MNSLTEIYNEVKSRDAEWLEKQAAEIKMAEDLDAAGRIMARGFRDELLSMHKQGMPGQTIPETPNDIGALKNYKVNAQGKGSGINPQGQKVQQNKAGGFSPVPAPKPPGQATQQ